MSYTVSAEEFVTAFQKDWPTQYELTALRLVNQLQAQRIADLEEEPQPPDPEA